jgi:hypothetical protein
MATFSELKTDKYYLIKEKEASDIALVYVLMETEKAVFLEYEDEMETMVWKKKADPISEVVEELTDEQADLYESIVYEDEEEDGFSWEDLDEEDEDEDFSEDDDDDDDDDSGSGGGKGVRTRKLFN